ncbi:MAG TPA: hypothetical protein VLS89_18145 [Candidatus Nanopelagicales bacterium]|nr:hypothetical protein [Candidatus Nanopelagicales bacterium]
MARLTLPQLERHLFKAADMLRETSRATSRGGKGMAPPVPARLLLTLLALAVVLGCGAAAPDHGGRPGLEKPPLPPASLDAAGTLPGTAAVQQGAFTYRIPLQVPGGRMGM